MPPGQELYQTDKLHEQLFFISTTVSASQLMCFCIQVEYVKIKRYYLEKKMNKIFTWFELMVYFTVRILLKNQNNLLTRFPYSIPTPFFAAADTN